MNQRRKPGPKATKTIAERRAYTEKWLDIEVGTSVPQYHDQHDVADKPAEENKR